MRLFKNKTINIYIVFILVFIIIAVVYSLVNLAKSSDSKSKKEQIILPTPDAKILEFKGSIPYWDQDRAWKSFQENMEVFSYAQLFWYYTGEDGSINKYEDAVEDPSIIRNSQEQGVKVVAVVTNLPEEEGTSWDSERVEENIESPEKRKRHTDSIMDIFERFPFDGVLIDYEEVDRSARKDFSDFIRDLSIQVHSKNKFLVVALHPKNSTRDERRSNGAFQDWQELSKSADQLQIMAYNEHWDGSSSGPIASSVWVESIIRYTQDLKIPPEKFFLGIPLYGYDWNKDTDDAADGVEFTDVSSLLNTHNEEVRWDQEDNSPYFTYTQSGDEHEVWFENSQSVIEKIKLAKNAGFKGVSFWRLGEEDPSIWDTINIK